MLQMYHSNALKLLFRSAFNLNNPEVLCKAPCWQELQPLLKGSSPREEIQELLNNQKVDIWQLYV